MTFDEFYTKATEMQNEIKKLDSELKNKVAEYKAFTKSVIGLADGEQNDIVQIMKAVREVNKLG
jgi:DNA-binding protein YbaB